MLIFAIFVVITVLGLGVLGFALMGASSMAEEKAEEINPC